MAMALRAGAGAAVALGASDRVALKGIAETEQRWSRLSCFSPRTRGGERSIGIACAAEQKKRRAFVVVKAAGEGVETEVEEVLAKPAGDVLPSDQWPDTFSMLNFEDLSAHYEPILFKEEAQPETYLADVMSKVLYTAFPDQALAEVEHFFENITGVPVVDQEHKVIGVLSKKDTAKASSKESKVKEVMSTPAITLSADKTVQDAAVLMLKNKIHRIPIVNSTDHVVGIVTRTDIFTALDTKN